MKPFLEIIILARDEELNLPHCLESVKSLGAKVWVVDSGSSDRTVAVAGKHGAEVVMHTDYINQAQQFNWALDNLDIRSDWILKLDADEYILPELQKEIKETLLKAPADVSGFYMKRRVYFMNRWIRYGGYYPTWFLRLWRKGKGRAEERKMDEHIILLEGKSGRLDNDFIDDNRKGLKSWIEKHKNYASREAEEIRAGKYGEGGKRNFYYRMPPFLRVFFYFVYRYFFKLGFLDGIPGLIFHFLHGFWYRFLVDAKIYGLSRI